MLAAGVAVAGGIALAVALLGRTEPTGDAARSVDASAALASAASSVALEVVDDLGRDSQGAASSDAAAARAELDAAVAAIEAEDYAVSYIVIGIDSGDTLGYNADAVYYGASSIKAPWCVSLLEAEGTSVREEHGDEIASVLQNSDNDAYISLWNEYDADGFFTDFCEGAGVDDIEFEGSFAFYSARDLARLWVEAADWLEAGSDDAAWAGSLMSDSLNSRVDDVAGEGGAVTTMSKAGWYWQDPDYNVSADGGLVLAPSGTYAIAVMTGKGSDFDAVESVMGPLVRLWNAQAS